MSNEYRLVVCLDVQADSLEEAYKKTFEGLTHLGFHTDGDIQWESTDESFGPDGEVIPEEEFQAARMKVYAQLEAEGKIGR